LTLIAEAQERETAQVSVGLIGNAAEIFPELVLRGVSPGCGHRPDPGA
jgi:urocanate hydratase